MCINVRRTYLDTFWKYVLHLHNFLRDQCQRVQSLVLALCSAVAANYVQQEIVQKLSNDFHSTYGKKTQYRVVHF